VDESVVTSLVPVEFIVVAVPVVGSAIVVIASVEDVLPSVVEGMDERVGSTVLVSVVDVLVLVDVVGALVVCPAAVVPNPSAPSSFAHPNGLSGPQLLLIPQPSDAMGARSRRMRANMTVLATIAGAGPSTQGFSTGAAASADVPWAVSGAG
jgi:hypothetical protein